MAVIPYKMFRDFRIPQGGKEDYFQWAADYHATTGDVFVVSYPKCGTTWMQHIVYLLAKEGRPADSMEEVVMGVPFPEQDGPPHKIKPLAYKSHLPLTLMRLEPEARYLYVARNPKDSCVSYYHFLKNLPGYQIGSLSEFFDAFLAGEVPYGDFVDHVLPWHEASHLPNVLFLTYESLSTHREREIARIADFLGYSPLKNDVLQDIVRYSSFEFMKDLASRDNFMKGYLRGSTGLKSQGAAQEPRMMRRGVVGDWRNHLSQEQSVRMDTYFRNRTRGTALGEEWATEMGFSD